MTTEPEDRFEMPPVLKCGKVMRGETHSPHRWVVQADDNSPDRITVACPGLGDLRPHSRACGIRHHDHGPDCHANCPTCGGQR